MAPRRSRCSWAELFTPPSPCQVRTSPRGPDSAGKTATRSRWAPSNGERPGREYRARQTHTERNSLHRRGTLRPSPRRLPPARPITCRATIVSKCTGCILTGAHPSCATRPPICSISQSLAHSWPLEPKPFASTRWRPACGAMGGRRSSTPTRGRSSPVKCSRTRGCASARTAGAAAWTTSRWSSCGDRRNTRRSS
jgi:hypothetical protein